MQRNALSDRLAAIRDQARQYFEEAMRALAQTNDPSVIDSWRALPTSVKELGQAVAGLVAALATDLGPAIRNSPLLTEVDEKAAGRALKGMRAALRFKRLHHWDAHVLADEDVVLGVQRAGESEEQLGSVVHAEEYFEECAEELRSRLELLNPEQTISGTSDEPTGDEIIEVRPNFMGVGLNLRALWRRWRSG